MNFPPALNLGQLIEILERRCASNGEDQDIQFDFAYMEPDYLDSYRGFYEDLSIGFKQEKGRLNKASLLVEALKAAIGKNFEGWKGGTYRMHENSCIWVANPGHTGSTIITGLADCNYITVLKTEYQNV